MGELYNGAVIDLSDLGTSNLSIRTSTYETRVGSVRFQSNLQSRSMDGGRGPRGN